MALKTLNEYLKLAPKEACSADGRLWSTYDADGDVLYIHFGESRPATDSELTDNDVILRYGGDEVIGITVLNASKR